MENREVAKILQRNRAAARNRRRHHRPLSHLRKSGRAALRHARTHRGNRQRRRQAPRTSRRRRKHGRPHPRSFADRRLRPAPEAPEKVSAHNPRAARTPVPGRQKSSPALQDFRCFHGRRRRKAGPRGKTSRYPRLRRKERAEHPESRRAVQESLRLRARPHQHRRRRSPALFRLHRQGLRTSRIRNARRFSPPRHAKR